MTRPSPLAHDLTPEEALLEPVCNAWRRQLLRFCSSPKSKRDVFREFACAGKKQRYRAINELCASGWLREGSETFQLNNAAVCALEQLTLQIAGEEAYPFEDRAACDATIAALRRKSCRAVLSMLRSREQPVLWREVRDGLELTPLEAKTVCSTLCDTYAVREVTKGVFERTHHGFPALVAYLESLKEGHSERP